MKKPFSGSQDVPPPSAQRDLAEEIHLLRIYLRRINKPYHRFWMGMLGGVGGVIGASLIAAPLIYGISKLLQVFGVGAPEF